MAVQHGYLKVRTCRIVDVVQGLSANEASSSGTANMLSALQDSSFLDLQQYLQKNFGHRAAKGGIRYCK